MSASASFTRARCSQLRHRGCAIDSHRTSYVIDGARLSAGYRLQRLQLSRESSPRGPLAILAPAASFTVAPGGQLLDLPGGMRYLSGQTHHAKRVRPAVRPRSPLMAERAFRIHGQRSSSEQANAQTIRICGRGASRVQQPLEGVAPFMGVCHVGTNAGRSGDGRCSPPDKGPQGG